MKIVIRGKGHYELLENVNKIDICGINNELILTINGFERRYQAGGDYEGEIEAIMVICGNHKEVTLKELADLFKSKEYIFSFCAIEIILKD